MRMNKKCLIGLLSCAITTQFLVGCNGAGSSGGSTTQLQQQNVNAVDYSNSGLYYSVDKNEYNLLGLGAIQTKDLAKNLLFWYKLPNKNWQAEPALDVIAGENGHFTVVGPEIKLSGLDGETVEVKIQNTVKKTELVYQMKVFGDAGYEAGEVPVGAELNPGEQWAVTSDYDRKPRVIMLNRDDHTPMFIGYNPGSKKIEARELQGDKSIRVDSLQVTKNGIGAQFGRDLIDVSTDDLTLTTGLRVATVSTPMEIVANNNVTDSQLFFANKDQQIYVFTKTDSVTLKESNIAAVAISANKPKTQLMTAQLSSITPADISDNNAYAKSAFGRDHLLESDPLIPHRTYYVQYTCSINGNKPCTKNDINRVSASTQQVEQVSLATRDMPGG